VDIGSQVVNLYTNSGLNLQLGYGKHAPGRLVNRSLQRLRGRW
jgi:hypothetical protein